MALHSLSKLPTTTSALIPRTEPDPTSRPSNLQSPWLSANSLSLPPPSLRVRTQEPKVHRFSATVCLSLPTANAEIVSSTEKVPKWSWRAIKSFAMGELEARKPSMQLLGLKQFSWGSSLREPFSLPIFYGKMQLHY
ncbi:ATP-dependent Clp protease ATP-binding subunit CLPT2, chloroplastic-like isoform X2 [Pyrus communis]|uniref:ATP-dependent Clp protease ATP-binding subunit CLPT2, chloroplastic-like isoform X2 n=1 Tax=Pyrus communis TaxID=23211 RepID=UPI0035BF65B9